MQIKRLFEKLEIVSDDAKDIFADSGMINTYNVLDYGFFPLGSGILTEKCKAEEAKIEEGGIMILGNDFGTKSYIEKRCENQRESSNNSTIRNLLSKLKLDQKNTFFTNFYLGIRDDASYKGTTNTQRVKPIEEAYKSFCYNFFLAQLEFINPKVIICLGHAVRLAISENFKKSHKWKGKTMSLSKLYNENNHHFEMVIEGLENKRFIVIPHPCDTRNFNDKYIEKILEVIDF